VIGNRIVIVSGDFFRSFEIIFLAFLVPCVSKNIFVAFTTSLISGYVGCFNIVKHSSGFSALHMPYI
jgi:hypothetical protein